MSLTESFFCSVGILISFNVLYGHKAPKCFPVNMHWKRSWNSTSRIQPIWSGNCTAFTFKASFKSATFSDLCWQHFGTAAIKWIKWRQKLKLKTKKAKIHTSPTESLNIHVNCVFYVTIPLINCINVTACSYFCVYIPQCTPLFIYWYFCCSVFDCC